MKQPKITKSKALAAELISDFADQSEAFADQMTADRIAFDARIAALGPVPPLKE